MPIQVALPASTARAADLPPGPLASHLMMLLAVDLVRQHTLSPTEGADLAGLSVILNPNDHVRMPRFGHWVFLTANR